VSSKHRRKGHAPQVSATGAGQEIERLIEKHRLKDAYKQAKLLFQQDGGPENRRLLERTYLLRIQDLSRGGMPQVAAEVARNFIEFGVTDAGLLAELVALLPRIGLADQAMKLSGRLESAGDRAKLTLLLVDRAVVQPMNAPGLAAEVSEGAERVRQALAALDADDEARSVELLRDISRGSPWADWRLFVRGWAAFRRGDHAQADANWQRLEPGRLAQRITAALRALTAPRDPKKPPDLSLLEKAVFGEPVLGGIDRLRRLIENPDSALDDWKQAEPLIASLRRTLGQIAPRLPARLTEILLSPLADIAETLPERSVDRLLAGFTRVAAPLTIDPHFNRLRAVLWERSGHELTAINYWRQYLDDIHGIASVDDKQRARMLAVVWRKLSGLFNRRAEHEMRYGSPWGSPEPEDDASEVSRLRGDVFAALEESIKADPTYRAAYDQLIELRDSWKEPDEAAEAARRLLRAFPDDAPSLERLFQYHRRRDEPRELLDHIQRYQALKPLDTRFVGHESWARYALARHLAIDGRFDEGRQQLSLAEALDPEFGRSYWGLARRAVCEMKAKQPERAGVYECEARATLSEPAPLHLVLAIEASRYRLPAVQVKQFNAALRADLTKKKSGVTAAKLAKIMHAYLQAEVTYPEFEGHMREVLSYVKRTSRVRYEAGDLTAVCHFLQATGGDPDLLSMLVRRGRRDFKQSPEFLMLSVTLQMPDVRSRKDMLRVRDDLRKALDLAKAASTGRDPAAIANIERQLLLVEDLVENAPRGLPFDPFTAFSSFFEEMANSFSDDDEDDDDGDDHGWGFGPPARRHFAAGQAKRKRR
jgi:tetratricopeptide (TPR) repeat protein